jgi:hypothetical protein
LLSPPRRIRADDYDTEGSEGTEMMIMDFVVVQVFMGNTEREVVWTTWGGRRRIDPREDQDDVFDS